MPDLPSRKELEILSLLGHERTGREIAQAYQRCFGRAISYGTLYATLGRAKDEGWIRSRQVKSAADGRFRYFKLTEKGKRARNRGMEDQSTFLDRAAQAQRFAVDEG